MEKREENVGKFIKERKEKEKIAQKTEWYILICYFATL